MLIRTLIVASLFAAVAGCEYPATKMEPVEPTPSQTQTQKQPPKSESGATALKLPVTIAAQR